MNRYLKIFNNLILLSKKNKSRRNYKISIYLIKKKNKIIKNVEISKKLKNLFKNFLHLIEEFLKNHNSKYWIKYLEKIVKVELNFNLNIELILEEIDKNELSRNLKSIMKVIKRIKYKKNRIENICYDHESNNYIYSRRKFTVKSLKKNFFEKNKKIKKDVSKFILFDLLNKIYLKDGRFISNLNQNQFLIKPMKDQSKDQSLQQLIIDTCTKIKKFKPFKRKKTNRIEFFQTKTRIPNLKKSMLLLFPANTLPFDETILTLSEFNEFEELIRIYISGIIKTEELIYACEERVFSKLPESFKKFICYIETRGINLGEKSKNMYHLKMIQGQKSYHILDRDHRDLRINKRKIEMNLLNKRTVCRSAIPIYISDIKREKEKKQLLFWKENKERILEIEDESYQIDLGIEICFSLLNALKNMKEYLEYGILQEPLKQKGLDFFLTHNHMSTIQTFYGKKTRIICNLLEMNSQQTVSVLIRRIKIKLNEWRRYKNLNRNKWNIILESNKFVSLDQLSPKYSFLFKHAMKITELWVELNFNNKSLANINTKTYILIDYEKELNTEISVIVNTLGNCIINVRGLLCFNLKTKSKMTWNSIHNLFNNANSSLNTKNSLKCICCLFLDEIFNFNEIGFIKIINIFNEFNSFELQNWDIPLYKILQKRVLENLFNWNIIPIVHNSRIRIKYRFKQTSTIFFATKLLYSLFRHLILFHNRIEECFDVMDNFKFNRNFKSTDEILESLFNLLKQALSGTIKILEYEKEVKLFCGPRGFRILSVPQLVKDINKLIQALELDNVSKKLLILLKIHKKKMKILKSNKEFQYWMKIYESMAWHEAKKITSNLISIQFDKNRHFLTIEKFNINLTNQQQKCK